MGRLAKEGAGRTTTAAAPIPKSWANLRREIEVVLMELLIILAAPEGETESFFSANFREAVLPRRIYLSK